MPTRSRLIFALLAVALAILFVRLGFWQLSRRVERREANAFREGRAAMPALRVQRLDGAVDAGALPSLDSVVWRTVRLEGRFDVDREIVLRSRSRAGYPGVEILTPLLVRSEGQAEEAILILRGWLPAPDGLRPRLSDAWPPGWIGDEPGRAIEVEGIAMPGTNWAGAPIQIDIEDRRLAVLGSVNLETVGGLLPYPVADFYIRATDPGPRGPGLELPQKLVVSEGRHLSYALQWFSFAIISLVGAGIFIRKEHVR